MPLSRREQKVVIGGAGVATILLVYLLWPSGAPTGSEVELVPAEQRQAQGGPPVPAAPPPPIAVPAPTVVAPPEPAAGAGGMPEGLVLTGITGRGAIFAFGNGGQRYVPLGRDVAPGLRLQAVRMNDVIIAVGATAYRLGFGGAPRLIGPPGGPAPADGAGAADGAQLRQMLVPRQVNGRVQGYSVRPGAIPPLLQQAGVQPGDTIVNVNGSILDPERLDELAWTVQNSTQTELEVERGGRRVRLSIAPRR